METLQKMRIHPLAAGAAVAVIITSVVAVAAMTGHLPGSNAASAPAQQLAVAPASPAPAVPPAAVAPAPAAPDRFPPVRAPEQVVAQAPAQAPAPVQAQAAPACANCGVVQSVGAYEVHPKKSVVGMVGGGVVGALVGNQIGHGTTNTIATVGGAAGGAYLGNEIGKKVQKTTRYRVVVRLDSGHTRTFTYAARPDFSAGNQVRVENGVLRHG